MHRRLLYDDNKGVVEPLDETAFGEGLVIRGKHVVQFNHIPVAADAHRRKAVETAFRPVPSFAKTNLTFDEWREKYNSSVRHMFSVFLILKFNLRNISYLPANYSMYCYDLVFITVFVA